MKTFLQPLQNLAEMEEIQKQAKRIVEFWRSVVVWSPRKLILCMGFPGFFHVIW